MNTNFNKPFISRASAFFLIILVPITMLAIVAHLQSKKLSNFELSCKDLGFLSKSNQNTIIEILLRKDQLSEMSMLGCIKSLNFENKDKILLHTKKQVSISKVLDRLGLLGVNYLRKNLFKCLTPSQSTETLVWLLQKNYKRTIGTERIELSDTTEVERNFYLDKLASLGMFEELYPKRDNYDAIWILGASRQNLIRRISNYIKYCDITKNKEKISVLAANDRVLSDKLDGLSNNVRLSINPEIIDTYNRSGYQINNTDDRSEDGKKYIQYLLDKKNNNSINESKKSTNKLNFKQVYESDMAQDVLDQCFSTLKARVESTKKHKNSIYIRSTTHDTVRFVAEKLAKQIFEVKNISPNKVVNILVCTDNIFAPRQCLITKQESRRVFEKIKNQSMTKENVTLEFDVLAPVINDIYGFNSSIVLSEFSSLILEKYRQHLVTKHQVKNLDLELALRRVSFVNQDYSEEKLTNNNKSFKRLMHYLFTNPFLVLFSCR